MYELDMEPERLFNEAVSFEAFLRRDKSQWKDAAKASLVFVRFYKKLITGKPKTKQIMAEIKAAKFLFFKNWLLEKFEHYRPIK